MTQQSGRCPRQYLFLQLGLSDQLRDEVQADVHGRDAGHRQGEQLTWIALDDQKRRKQEDGNSWKRKRKRERERERFLD